MSLQKVAAYERENFLLSLTLHGGLDPYPLKGCNNYCQYDTPIVSKNGQGSTYLTAIYCIYMHHTQWLIDTF